MGLSAIYDQIATKYKIADQFGSISQSHRVALKQILNTQLTLNSAPHILDLGVGDGAFLDDLNHNLLNGQYIGVDISNEMLEIAKRKLPLKTFECSASDISQKIPPHTQDLAIAHFVNAYIPINQLFSEVNAILKANGLFSFITTTYESFPIAQQKLAEFIAEDTIVSRVVGHYYKSVVRNTTVAANLDDLFLAFHQHEFEIVAHERLELPILLDTVDDLAQFGIEGTWFLNSLNIRLLPKDFLLARLKRIFAHLFNFPYQDTHIIDIVLARK